MISAILLAAGQSRRMGKFKQLLPFGNKTFITSAITSLLAANVDELCIVLGHRASDIIDFLSKEPYFNKIKTIINENYLLGMTGSVQTGLKVVNPNAKAFLIALVDQPHIPTEIINQLIESYYQNQALIVKPAYKERSGHPIIIDIHCKEEILNLPIETGLNQVTRKYVKETLLVSVTSSVVLEDFDTPEDYARYRT